MMLVFCGIPGSGKTTIASQFARKLPGKVIQVETDKFRFMIPHPTYERDESGLVYDAMFATARIGLMHGYTVILDATFTKEEHRAGALYLAQSMGTPCRVIYVECSLSEALKRNRFRNVNRRIPPEVIKRLASNFEIPENALRIDAKATSPSRSAAIILADIDQLKSIPV